MSTWAMPVCFALFLWWSSTVLVLFLNGLSRPAARRSFHVGTALTGVALIAFALTLERTDAFGAYVAFSAGLLLWGWHELSYYAGVITGPRSEPCPDDASLWERFRTGVQTSLHHELAVVATAGLLAIATAGAANTIGFWTFTVLWLMRWSAKLNIFFGVRNLHEEFWPDHLRYLSSYARRRSMNPLFPFSVLISGTVLGVLVARISGAAEDPGGMVGPVLIATLLALAILEHALLMMPISDERLWRWGMRSRSSTGGPPLPSGTDPKAAEST